MDNAVWGMLNDAEQALLREAAPKALDELDEDGLAALHDRVRRARNKYSKLYRRRAAAEVGDAGARAKGHARHARTLVKAEAFEEALADVSRALARAARASATALRQERLAQAKVVKGGGGKAAGKGAKTPKAEVKAGRNPAKQRTPASEKRAASTKAKTKRRQAARDAR